jgi:hypothetical protein
VRDALTVTDVANLQLEQVAGPQLAVDAKIEEGQFPCSTEDLEPDPDSPNLFEFERRLLTDNFAFVPRSGNNRHPNLIHCRLLKVGGSRTLTPSLHGAAWNRRKADFADLG